MNTSPLPRRAWRALALAATLAAGCYGGPDDASGSANSISINPEPVPLNRCTLFGQNHTHTTAATQGLLDAVDVTLPTPPPFAVDVDTSNGNCVFAPAQVGSGVRVRGSFQINTTLRLRDNLDARFVAGAGGVPYFLKVTASLGDIRFASVGDLDISVPCLGLDRNLEGTLRDLEVEVYYRPPRPGQNRFTYDHFDVDFGTVSVVNPDALIPSFGPVVTTTNAWLASAGGRALIEDSIEAAVAPQIAPLSNLSALFTLSFWGPAPGVESSATICSASRTDDDHAAYRIVP